MSVLVYAESWNGVFRKSTFEAVSYAKKTSEILGTDVVAVSLEKVLDEELNKLSTYGASHIVSIANINKGDNQAASKVIAELSDSASVIVFSNTLTSKMIAPRLSVKLNAACITNVISLTETESICVSRKSFSSKAIEFTKSNTEKTIICIAPNSFGVIEDSVDCNIEISDFSEKGSILFNGQETASGKISISEAEIVVSAGRGLKGPENWGMIEELADLLGAATACSKPVSDIGWRPHSEHVGQTGKAVAADLYIAIGISGAIQHLAGVNSSKVMVAINTDPEAPFFKAADYGIIGDAFEVIPKLIEEIKKIKN
jgi:electron transfer flavoprotein alpha subunit